MRATPRPTLDRSSPPVPAPRAREREALHEFDDGRLVLEHLAGDPQAFGTLVDRYQTRLLNFINRTIGDRERRSEERRVGKEGRTGGGQGEDKKRNRK